MIRSLSSARLPLKAIMVKVVTSTPASPGGKGKSGEE